VQQEFREGNCIEVEDLGVWDPEVYAGEKRAQDDSPPTAPASKVSRTRSATSATQQAHAASSGIGPSNGNGQAESMQTDSPAVSPIPPKSKRKIGLPPPPIRLQASGTPYNVLDMAGQKRWLTAMVGVLIVV
jgi:hypothetical protein